MNERRQERVGRYQRTRGPTLSPVRRFYIRLLVAQRRRRERQPHIRSSPYPVASSCPGAFVYSAPQDHSVLLPPIQFMVFPAMALSGVWIWQQ
jgi:hypothetical protein